MLFFSSHNTPQLQLKLHKKLSERLLLLFSFFYPFFLSLLIIKYFQLLNDYDYLVLLIDKFFQHHFKIHM